MGWSVLVFFLLTQWDTNDNNLWASSLAWVNTVGGKLSRRHWVAIMGIVGTIWATMISAGYGASLAVLFKFGEILGVALQLLGSALTVFGIVSLVNGITTEVTRDQT